METQLPPPLKLETAGGPQSVSHEEVDLMAHLAMHKPEQIRQDESVRGMAGVMLAMLDERRLLFSTLAEVVRAEDHDDPVHAASSPQLRAARELLGWKES